MTDLSPDAREPTNPNKKLNRRGFLKGAAANAAAVGALGILEAIGTKAAEETGFQDIESRKPSRIKTINLGQWQIVGVEHTHKFWEEHQGTLEALVKGSGSHVALEYFYPEIQRFAVPGTKIPKPTTFAQSLEYFFAQIAQICAENDQHILVANPENSASAAIFWTESTGPLGIGLRHIGEGFYQLLRSGRINRRGFLKGLGLASLAILPQIPAKTGLILRHATDQHDNPQFLKEQLQLFWRSYLDWRDVCVALGLQKAKIQLNINQRTAVIQGYGHNAVASYLQPENQETLDGKEDIYPELNAFGDRTVREFTYNHAQGRWTQTRALSY